MFVSESTLLQFSLYFPFVVFAALAVLDVVRPARQFETLRFWRTRGLVYFASYIAIATLAPLVWTAFLAEHRVFDLTSWSLFAQTTLAILAVELFVYAWHRTLHSVPALWRWLHQMHHSSERVDIWGALVFHPLDVVGFSFVGSLGLVGLVGVSVPAAVITNATVFFISTVQHANIKTPHWLGYLVGRPEMHGVHHQRGVHAYNYCDLPFIDMLFGTFNNPKTWEAEAGFYSGGSERVLEMLAGKDISYGETRAISPAAHKSSRRRTASSSFEHSGVPSQPLP
jgi:sterol desaturase/sphingolipid hydroxylase (fatty acid hydroxylase superfamily)